MRKYILLMLFIALIAIFLFTVPLKAQQQYTKLQGYAQKGGQKAVVSGISSSNNVQQSFPSCTVTVFNSGTVTLSTIYSDASGTPKANPFTADSDAYWFFYAAPGRYDVRFSGSGISTPFTNGDYFIELPGSVSVSLKGTYRAVGNGSTNDSTQINLAVSDSSSFGYKINVEPGTYILGSSLGSSQNVSFICPTNNAVFKAQTGSSIQIFANLGNLAYKNWTVEGIEFDNNNQSFSVFTDTTDITFTRCKFRGNTNGITLQSASIKFIQCIFYGTQSGIMSSGTNDPAAVSNAVNKPSISINGGSSDLLFDTCYFHFSKDALAVNASSSLRAKNITIRNCSFRGDWFNGPYINLRFTGNSYNTGTKVLTVSGGGLTGHFPSGTGSPNVCSIRVQISTGASFNSVFGGNVTSAGFGSIRIGDVIETSNGKRAEIISLASNSSVQITNWEDVSTFEPTTAPALATSWRVSRYYAGSAEIISDTSLQLITEPVNVFTGELLGTGAGITTNWVCRELPNMNYTGVHVSGGANNLLVQGNYFRGSWSDQLSVFNTENPRLIGNTIEFGQDEGITITTCPRAVVIGNTFNNSGVSGIFTASPYASITGNTFYNWALVNRGFAQRSAIEFQGATNSNVTGNTFSFDSTTNYGGLSAYAFSLFGDSSAGTQIIGNLSVARTGDLYIESSAGSIIARDMLAIDGTGAGNVFPSVEIQSLYSLQFGVLWYYNMSEPTGASNDAIGHANLTDNDGTIVTAQGAVGNARRFIRVGDNEFFTTPDSSLVDFGDTNWTIAGMAYLDDLGAFYTIVSKDTGLAGGREVFLFAAAGGGDSFGVVIYNGTSQVGQVVGSAITATITGNWHFVLAYHDATNNIVGIEVDGVAVTAATTGAMGTSTANLTFGGDGAHTSLNGRLQRWGRWNRLLTEAEKDALRNGNKGRAWPFTN